MTQIQIHTIMLYFVTNYACCQLLSLFGFSSIARLYCGYTHVTLRDSAVVWKGFTTLKQIYACLVEHYDHADNNVSQEVIQVPV